LPEAPVRLLSPMADNLRQGRSVKCRTLRRRYIVFRTGEKVRAQALLESIANAASPSPADAEAAATQRGGKPNPGNAQIAPPVKVVYNDGEYAVVRLDQISFSRLRARFRFPIVIRTDDHGGSATSLFCTGSIKKAKIRIKAIRGNIVMGMKRPSQSIQNAKDVELKRSEGESPAGGTLRPLS